MPDKLHRSLFWVLLLLTICLLISHRSKLGVEGRANSDEGSKRLVATKFAFAGRKVGVFARPAFATLTVGTGQTYTTIQSAVTAATSGDTINVLAGNYTSEGTISISNKVLTILGPQVGQSPNTNAAAWATSASLATVGRFNVTGTGGLSINGLRLVGAPGGGDDDSAIISLGPAA